MGYMKKIKLSFLFLFSFYIVSCGFHLRGNQDISEVLPEVTVAGVDKHSDLGRELIRSLVASKVNVINDSETVLNITNDTFSKRVLSLDSAGRANQYELIYKLNFILVKLKQGENDNKQQKSECCK